MKLRKHERGELFTNKREVLFTASSILNSKCAVNNIIHEVLGTITSCGYLSGNNQEFMFFNTVERKDHKELFEMIKGSCQFNKGDLKWNKCRRLNFYNLVNLIINIPRLNELKRITIPEESINKKDEKYIKLNGLQLVWLYIRLIRNLGDKKSISKYDWTGVKAVVVLYDIGQPEHFVIEDANDCGIKTIVLSHGILLPEFDHLDIGTFNLYKVPSKFLLSWGEDVKDIITARGEKTIVIPCGCPRIKEDTSEILKNVIGIAGSVPYDMKANKAMIHIAEQYAKSHNMQVRIRLHPLDKGEHYDIDQTISEFNGDIVNCEVIIGYRTAMIFTYMIQGKRVFRYKDEFPYYDFAEGIEFETVDELEDNMRNLYSINFKSIAQKHISCIGQDSLVRYREAFQMIRDWKNV